MKRLAGGVGLAMRGGTAYFPRMNLEISHATLSSSGLDNRAGWTPRSSRERVLMHLKMHGEATAGMLGEALGTSAEAVRQLLVKLGDEGVVVARSTGGGVGRPAQYWSLTGAGHARFPDTHAALTVDLIATLRDTLGEAGLDAVISAREQRMAQGYGERLAGARSLYDRVVLLAQLRSEEGYMAEARQDADGSCVLVENHCPICAAATACQNFCRSELALFATVLGPGVSVTRSEHIVAGARRCTYLIAAVG